MKKLFISLIGCAAMFFISAAGAKAQNYNTALGMRIEAGDGSTGVGFNAKHFFSSNTAIDANLLFYDGDGIGLGAEVQWNNRIQGASGLDWYLGLGPNFLFYDNLTFIQLRPVAGLDYKIPNAPIDFAFDWRPAFQLNHDTDFSAARFGISLRYAF